MLTLEKLRDPEGFDLGLSEAFFAIRINWSLAIAKY